VTHKIRRVDVENSAYYLKKLCQNVGLETWIWRQIVTSQTAHTNYKWPPYAIEWNPPHENFLRTPLLGIFSPDFHSGSVARSGKPIECMLKTVEKMLAVPNRLQKVNGWSWGSRLWHPRRLGCDCLSNSCKSVVLNPGSEGRIRLPTPFVRPLAVFQ